MRGGEATRDLREAFAVEVTRRAGVTDPRIVSAFAQTPRELFAGPGPWVLSGDAVFGRTPDADPKHLYRDALIAIDQKRGINIGEPSLHALCLAALTLRAGDAVVQVGAGVGYYTAMLAALVAPGGRVIAYEIEADLAERATRNLAELAHVEIRAVSGVEGPLPEADAIYVNAAASHPCPAWLDALKPGGRLVFPLQAAYGTGAMLALARPQSGEVWAARILALVSFIPCIGAEDPAIDEPLRRALQRGDWRAVKSFGRGPPPAFAWLKGGRKREGWWLSTDLPPGA